MLKLTRALKSCPGFYSIPHLVVARNAHLIQVEKGHYLGPTDHHEIGTCVYVNCDYFQIRMPRHLPSLCSPLGDCV